MKPIDINFQELEIQLNRMREGKSFLTPIQPPRPEVLSEGIKVGELNCIFIDYDSKLK